MSTQILLDVPDDIYRQVRSVATRTQQAVADVLLDSIARSFAPFPIDPRRAEMSRNVEAFIAMHPKLVKEYLDKTVAIFEGRLVDYDTDPIALLHRVRQEYPNRVVLRRKVELLAERVLQIRHPRIETDL